MAHRLDRLTTGCQIAAKSKRSLQLIQAMFKQETVLKRYWAITRGVPDPLEGLIKIPLLEMKVGQQYRMNLVPRLKPEQRNASSRVFVRNRFNGGLAIFKGIVAP